MIDTMTAETNKAAMRRFVDFIKQKLRSANARA